MASKSKQTKYEALAVALERTGASFDSYTRLYPDMVPRIKAILQSRDPKLRERLDVLQRALNSVNSARSSSAVRRFGLTPAQTRIALYLAQGGAVSEFAREFGVSEQTVRTHLKAIFAKTGVTRQAELAAMLAGNSKPRRV